MELSKSNLYYVIVLLKKEYLSYIDLYPYSLYNKTIIETYAISNKKAISNTQNTIFNEIYNQNQDIRIFQTRLELRKKINNIFEFDYVLA